MLQFPQTRIINIWKEKIDMRLTYNGHACFTLETEEGSAVFDPYAPGSVPGLTLPKLCADAAFCSHCHRDHGYAQGVRLTGNAPRFAVRQIDCFHDDVGGRLRGENTITVIEAEGIRVVHLGDLGHTLDDKQLDAIGWADVLLLPIGGNYTIDAVKAAKVAESLGATVIVPMHYRGEGFAYDVIDTADGFLASAENVKFVGKTLELRAPLEKMTAVMSF